MRLPLASSDVDAFSLPFGDRPIVVLGAEKNDRARSRFDAAHELGHLVIHGEQVWGLPAVERQAHQFAAAFLMPREDIIEQLPARADWPQLFALKRQWQVSLAALLMRARVLGRMNHGDYLTAIKAASARGWRRTEPVPLGPPEKPQLLGHVLAGLGERETLTVLPESVVDALASVAAT
jgi:Zn-dependent peptidase ImmA (M78 family)